MVDPRRVRALGPHVTWDPQSTIDHLPSTIRASDGGDAGPVVYWMSRDQRADDNWALLFAQEQAIAHARPLAVVFTLAPAFLGAQARHYAFMLAGLEATAARLAALDIAFVMLTGEPTETLPAWLRAQKAALVVADYTPLRPARTWRDKVAGEFPVLEVDAHNIVPVWVASPKLEFGAYTLRPKLRRLLPAFLTPFPALRKHPVASAGRFVNRPYDGAGYRWITPGPDPARAAMRAFFDERLAVYAEQRNDPNAGAVSGLSPYLHFGQLAPQRVAWEAQAHDRAVASQEAFLEELIVRRELSDNFCHYQPRYDSFAGFPAWARATLDAHRGDARPARYTKEQLEAGETGEPLWNAAQRRLVAEGRLHGYLRMYWAKKLLEWTASPEEALALGIEFNDRYALDGRDPNGYVGVAWSIGGVHDRAWPERPVFGKIRYMNAAGAKRKFDVKRYIAESPGAQP